VLNRLTSLEHARDWVGSNTNGDDLLLTRLIDEQSRFILSYLQRPTLFQYLFTDVYDGVGNDRQILRHWPVLSVTSVTSDYQTIAQYVIPQVPSPTFPTYGTGWVLEPWDGLPPGRPQAVSLRGYKFCRGLSNVQISYTAGFVIQNEAQTVPAAANYSVAVNAPYGSWGADQGVTYSTTGVSLTNVPFNLATTLIGGQYMVQGGIYYFAAADASAAVLISYSFVPSDIEHACMEMVGERYRYRNRIGEVSKSLGGQETMSFSQKNMPDYIRTLLQPYRRVVLI
jgi:hypothetical protein